MRYLLIISQHWLSLLLATILTGVLAAGVSFLPAQLYESQVELLIVQDKQESVDSYTAQRAAERLGQSLITVLPSTEFLDRVIATGYISEKQFSGDSSGDTGNAGDKQKRWEKIIKAEVIPESSVMRIYGYGEDVGTAEDIVLGISQVLTTQAAEYHGAGDSVHIRKISGPLSSTRPVKPNIPLNGIAGALLGFVAVYTFFLLKLESRQIKEEQQGIHYVTTGVANGVANNGYQQLSNNVSNDASNNSVQNDIFPLGPPEYKVLDEFPNDPFNYGAELEDQPQDQPENQTEDDITSETTIPETKIPGTKARPVTMDDQR